ncbi:MAG: LPXTG cell wall anchor domain-containing protein [Bacteroidota bacterium]
MQELKKKKHSQRTVNWQPYAGIGMMVIGGAFLVLGRKKSLTT